MKILLDECLPRKLKEHFSSHAVKTVPEAGFGGSKNGELILLAEQAQFEIFLTVDQGVQYQQNLTDRRIAILILRAPSNRLQDLLPLVDKCLQQLPTIKPGQVINIG